MATYQSLDNKPHLKFPLEKFAETYEKITPEDKIVDFMIAFESLVFYDAGNLAHKKIPMAIAVSMLLGKNQKERSRIRNRMTAAYNKKCQGSRACTENGRIQEEEHSRTCC
jgi:hypothetical protein